MIDAGNIHELMSMALAKYTVVCGLADMLWHALNAARKVLELPTYLEPEHWSKKS